MKIIYVNSSRFNTEAEALDYINDNLMYDDKFSSFDEAMEYLENNGHSIIIRKD